jgi:hypothetical protein
MKEDDLVICRGGMRVVSLWKKKKPFQSQLPIRLKGNLHRQLAGLGFQVS